jgi:hypothetical protein
VPVTQITLVALVRVTQITLVALVRVTQITLVALVRVTQITLVALVRVKATGRMTRLCAGDCQYDGFWERESTGA